MLRQVAVATLGAVALGFAVAPAGAVVSDTHAVNVNIEVAPNVSFWADDATVNLLLDGGPNNDDEVASGFSVINNVNAKVDVSVAGTLPDPIVPGGGVNFFLFYGVNPVDAKTAITANAYNPAGALVWTKATLGTSQQLTPAVGINTSIAHKLITYAAATPGELPLPDTFSLVATYTLTETP
jgi:hypothetical protein